MSGQFGRCLTVVALLLFASAPTWGHDSQSDGSTTHQDSANATKVSSGKSVRNGGSRWGASYFPNVPLVIHEGLRIGNPMADS